MSYPTTFLTLQDAVLNKLRLDITNDRDKVKDWINQKYAELTTDATHAYVTCATLTLTADESSYTLPAAPHRIISVISRPLSGSSYGPPLRATSIDELLDWRQGAQAVNDTSSGVSAYALLGKNRIEFYPAPGAADTVKIYYTYLPAELVEDSDIPDLQEPYPKALEWGAMAEAADFVKDPDAQFFWQQWELWRARFRQHLNRRQSGQALQLQVFDLFPGPGRRDVDVAQNW